MKQATLVPYGKLFCFYEIAQGPPPDRAVPSIRANEGGLWNKSWLFRTPTG